MVLSLSYGRGLTRPLVPGPGVLVAAKMTDESLQLLMVTGTLTATNLDFKFGIIFLTLLVSFFS